MESSEKDYGDVRLAARIVELRESRGMSIRAFAKEAGVSHPTQSRIERAKRMPDAMYLRALHERFWVDINALLTGKEEREDVGYKHEDFEAVGAEPGDMGEYFVQAAVDKARNERLRKEREERERKRGITARDQREADLLASWRAASDEGRDAIEATARAMAQAAAAAVAAAATAVAAVARAPAAQAARSSRRRTTASGSHSIAAGGNVVVVNHKS